jgi:hypothetical protein
MGVTLHNQGGPYGRANVAKRIVSVNVTGLPLCVRVVPASRSEASAVEQILDDLVLTGADKRLKQVQWTTPLSGRGGALQSEWTAPLSLAATAKTRHPPRTRRRSRIVFSKCIPAFSKTRAEAKLSG